MIFTTLEYFYFITAVLLFVNPLRERRTKLTALLIVSVLFYMSWSALFLILLFAQTAVDYVLAQYLEKQNTVTKRRVCLGLMMTINLSVLAYFKYANFFLSNVHRAWPQLGIPTSLHVILPLGISFYTFEGISYGVDVYRRKISAHQSLLEYWVFITFFPHLVAGPIVRAADFLPQLRLPKAVAIEDISQGALRIGMGAFKKLAVADNFGVFSDQFFAHPRCNAASAWLGIIAYTLQIYCDFSGYSDMAIGSAQMLGFHLTENFNWPYLATSLQDFWRRWHISLSSWLRDYLYFPLGGSRDSQWMTYRNVLITMLLGGLWHGASWTFVIWGAFHGIGLMIERLWSDHFPNAPWPPFLCRMYALIIVMLGWLFFRAPTFRAAIQVLTALVGQASGPSLVSDFGADGLWLLLIGVISFHAAKKYDTFSWMRLSFWQLPLPACSVAAFLLTLAAAWSPDHMNNPFIYFQF